MLLRFSFFKIFSFGILFWTYFLLRSFFLNNLFFLKSLLYSLLLRLCHYKVNFVVHVFSVKHQANLRQIYYLTNFSIKTKYIHVDSYFKDEFIKNNIQLLSILVLREVRYEIQTILNFFFCCVLLYQLIQISDYCFSGF